MDVMIYIGTEQAFETVVGAAKPTLVLFAGRWSELGDEIIAKMMLLNFDKVSIYQVDIDSSDGAEIAEKHSIQVSPTVMLFVAGVLREQADSLTETMVKLVS
jgi:hypothetical protein